MKLLALENSTKDLITMSCDHTLKSAEKVVDLAKK